MEQYDRRMVKVAVPLPKLHRLLRLSENLRITDVYYSTDNQTVELYIEGPTLARQSSWEEPQFVQLATLDIGP